MVAHCKLNGLYLIHEFMYKSITNEHCERSYAGAKIHYEILNVTQIIHSFKINFVCYEYFSKRISQSCARARLDSKRENLRGTHVIQLPTCNTIKSSCGGKYDNETTSSTSYNFFSLVVSLSLQIYNSV